MSRYVPPALAVRREFLKSSEGRANQKQDNEQPLSSTFKLAISSKDVDNPNSLIAAETLIMNEPHFSDFFVNGKPAGVVTDMTVLEGWILHIDELLERAENEPSMYTLRNSSLQLDGYISIVI